MEVRRAAPGDAGPIEGARVAGWKDAYQGVVPRDILDDLDDQARVPEWHDRLTELPHGCACWVAVDPHVVGFCLAGPGRHGVPTDAGEVHALYTHPSAWGRGAGTALLRTATRALHEQGYRTAVVWTLDGVARTHCFYRNQGFLPDGARRPFRLPDGRTVPSIRLVTSLDARAR